MSGTLPRLVLILLMVMAAAPAGEDDQGQPYTKVRYPTFDKNGRLDTLLEANTADVFDISEGNPRINLTDVVITIYDAAGAETRDMPRDRPPPVKMTITSDFGFFTRRPPEPGAKPEEIANLKDNVVVRQYKMPDGYGDPLRPSEGDGAVPKLETEIHCHHAQWNNTQLTLVGEGDVTFRQTDSVITGTGFMYIADDEAVEEGGSRANMKDWGGVIFIEHNARMEINRGGGSGPEADNFGASGTTIITCRDTAYYKLRDREIQFENDVRVDRNDLQIESDILKVFLRHENEPSPEPTAGGAGALMPGQVKNIVATIGRRPGSVIVTGTKVEETTGGRVSLYVAKGGRADFNFDTNRITLTDTREQRWPSVEFGENGDRISDGTLIFDFTQVNRAGPVHAGQAAERETVLDRLTTSGGRGEVVLRSPVDGGEESIQRYVTTVVDYRGDMNYTREHVREDGAKEGRIVFREKVNLRRNDLTILAELLDIRLIGSGNLDGTNQIRRIIAEDEVDIRTEDYQAKAQRAEYDVYSGVIGPPGSNLDTLRLFGPPQATPPHPWIREKDGNYISAPEIHMQRLVSGAVGQRDQHLVVARGGSSTCEFLATGDEDIAGKLVTIKCERGMEYNQALKKARFEGDVMAASDAPEDNYVLTSDRLVVDFEEAPDPANPGEFVTWIRRITAEGSARLMQDARVCEAINIIRDFPSSDTRAGDIYLQGAPARNGQPPVMAVYKEQYGNNQIGSMFASPLIKSTARGDLIQANGPGELSMPDEGSPDNPNLRAQIKFDGAASYKAMQDGRVSDANFWGGVVLSQPSRNVYITSDELDARFIRDEKQDDFGGHAEEIELDHIGRLRRAEGRGNVRIEHNTAKGHSIAVGDVGVVEFTGSGNIIRLTADRRTDNRRFVIARYHDGKTIRAPEIEVREAQGITRASGPGDLQLPADRGGEGMSELPTRILYGERGAMIYNELALNIKVNHNVRIVQPGAGDNWSFPSLDGICDRLEIALFEPPVAGMTGTDTLTRVSRMDAIGGVVLRVYADPPPENPNMNWLMRPGTTFFTRGDQAVYDVPKGEISIFCLDNRQPQLLLNIVEEGRRPQRQRLKADRFVLQTNSRPRKYNFHGNLDTATLREGEPFDFTGN